MLKTMIAGVWCKFEYGFHGTFLPIISFQSLSIEVEGKKDYNMKQITSMY